MAANPVIVEVTRGPRVESWHRGALSIRDDMGAPVLELGEVMSPVYPRSAVKAIQALPLVETGAAEAAGLGDREIALSCASHSGEAEHVETARDMLSRLGLGEHALACAPHQPRRLADQAGLARADEQPSRLHNNCSGKHAGMLIAARHLGLPLEGYEAPDHPLQLRIRQTMEEMLGVELTPEVCGIDGCALPTWAAPLSAFASAFARIGTGTGLTPERARAFARIRRAAASRPDMVAGTERFCTMVMEALGERCFVKTGAEGVFCASLPECGLGIALKVDDGAARASEAAMAAVLRRFFGGAEGHVLDRLARPAVTNWEGRPVGEIRSSVAFSEALGSLA
ncbi:asparaginase [Lutibaculum baratangense]|uniref:Asparaginase n=1 Tax=Lutibaculum baratangense AMV1 TaxID=631454 RepID=V4RJB3_9HYPH|nr:asparaginase [Lutibaculum baratangense]ESR26186.1 Hypothetical protein of L-Asparaginase type 2-like superfamily [Lutibaculum baratangense AMV1]